jgi:mRNA interferase RelE/StbE
MSYTLQYSSQAVKNLKKLPPDHAKVLYDWIGDNLLDCENPRTVPGYKPLVGTRNGVRYRVGKYRILVRLTDSILTIKVIRIAHRSTVYQNLPKDL